MKQFDQYLNEAYSTSSRGIPKEIFDTNAKNIGKPVIDVAGKPVPNSVVLSSRSYAYKKGNEILIFTQDILDTKAQQTTISVDELNMLKKL